MCCVMCWAWATGSGEVGRSGRSGERVEAGGAGQNVLKHAETCSNVIKHARPEELEEPTPQAPQVTLQVEPTPRGPDTPARAWRARHRAPPATSMARGPARPPRTARNKPRQPRQGPRQPRRGPRGRPSTPRAARGARRKLCQSTQNDPPLAPTAPPRAPTATLDSARGPESPERPATCLDSPPRASPATLDSARGSGAHPTSQQPPNRATRAPTQTSKQPPNRPARGAEGGENIGAGALRARRGGMAREQVKGRAARPTRTGGGGWGGRGRVLGA